MPPRMLECDDEDKEEEYFPKAPLDDGVWIKEPIQERTLCIHMAPGMSEASYNPQTTMYQQEYIPKQTTTYPQDYIPKQAAAYPQEHIPSKKQQTHRDLSPRQSLGMEFWVTYSVRCLTSWMIPMKILIRISYWNPGYKNPGRHC